jgi:hypothetical protein
MKKIEWGNCMWKTIHYIPLGYPENPTENEKQNYKNFYISLGNVIPCEICREHYKKNLISLPLTDTVLLNKDNLLKWTIDLHNIVNKKLGYPILSYQDALNIIYSNNTKNNNTKNNKLFNIILIIIIVFFIYNYSKKYLKSNNI